MINITGQWQGGATVDGVTATIQIRVQWASDDPLVLECEFDGTKWDIGRDLIQEAALKAPGYVGEGDVRAMVIHESLDILLSTTEGMARVWMPWWRMKNFLSKAYNIIPQGEEKLDVDDAIERILSS